MANTRDLNIKITAKDEASKSLGKLNDNLKKITPTFKQIAVAATAATAAISAGVGKAVADAVQFQQIEESYTRLTNKMGFDSQKLLSSLTDASASTVSNYNLMLASNKAMALGVGENMEDIATLMEIARLKGRALGLDTTQAFDDIVTGIGRGSPLILDNLGITIKLASAQEEYAASLGKTVEEMTDAEKKNAIFNAVITSGRKELEETGEVTLTYSERVQQLKKQLADLSVRIGTSLLPHLERMFEIINSLISQGAKFYQRIKEAGGIVQFLNDKLTSLLEFIDTKLGLITMLKDAWQNIALVFEQMLLPQLRELWEVLTPFKPFLEAFAKVIGVMLYGALIALIKLIEGSLIVVIAALGKAIEVVTGVVNIWHKAFDGFTTILSKAINLIDSLISKMKKLASMGGGIGDSFANLKGNIFGFDGARAAGGPVSGGRSYLVGEKGPELFTPGSNGTIVPNNRISGGGGGVNIVINGDVTGSEVVERVKQALMSQLNLNTRMTI